MKLTNIAMLTGIAATLVSPGIARADSPTWYFSLVVSAPLPLLSGHLLSPPIHVDCSAVAVTANTGDTFSSAGPGPLPNTCFVIGSSSQRIMAFHATQPSDSGSVNLLVRIVKQSTTPPGRTPGQSAAPEPTPTPTPTPTPDSGPDNSANRNTPAVNNNRNQPC